jgi:hypothetical protein
VYMPLQRIAIAASGGLGGGPSYRNALVVSPVIALRMKCHLYFPVNKFPVPCNHPNL